MAAERVETGCNQNHPPMKTKLFALLFALAVTPIFAGEGRPQSAPAASSPATVEQRFQEADISIALAQYEKLRMAAFEIELKLQVDPPADDKQRDEMAKKAAVLSERAEEVRAMALKRAAAVAAK
jgi:hypothetical protein